MEKKEKIVEFLKLLLTIWNQRIVLPICQKNNLIGNKLMIYSKYKSYNLNNLLLNTLEWGLIYIGSAN